MFRLLPESMLTRAIRQMLLGRRCSAPPVGPERGYQAGQGGHRHRDCMAVVSSLARRQPLTGPSTMINSPKSFRTQMKILQFSLIGSLRKLSRYTQYTHLDPVSPAGATVLATHFISLSSPNIHKKGKKSEEGPQTPIPDLVKWHLKSLTPERKPLNLRGS